ncbi:transcription factor GTE6-like [Bidens hawaiensis]|uniref:transcription factor GTE6-like n=1 Tax=Bidens hawaiensis TaxID=980011 RepID=UPI0040494532
MEEELIVCVDGLEIAKTEDNNNNNAVDDDIGHKVDDLFTKVDKLEQRVNEIEQFFLNASKTQSGSASVKSSFLKDKDKIKHAPGYKKYQQEAARREAVAAKRMQDIIRLGSAPGHRQARLVFSNAMKYNDDKSDVHGMAKTLLEKFEEKWLQFAPRVTEDEKRREEEEADALLSLQRAQEAAHAKMARDLSNEVK